MSQLNADAPSFDSKTSTATAITASDGLDPTAPTFEPPGTSDLQYVQLNPKYMANMCWSNNPNNLYLEVYFDESKPNLADDYGVDGLRPVIRENRSSRFILCDAKKRFYIWEEWDGRLLRVQEKYTKGFELTEEIVDNILDCISLAQFDAVAIWRNRTKH
jgi:hypothetical protein